MSRNSTEDFSVFEEVKNLGKISLQDLENLPLKEQLGALQLWVDLNIIPELRRTNYNHDQLEQQINSFKNSLTLAGKTLNDRKVNNKSTEERTFTCNKCFQNIAIPFGKDSSYAIQEHEHFEEILIEQLANRGEVENLSTKSTVSENQSLSCSPSMIPSIFNKTETNPFSDQGENQTRVILPNKDFKHPLEEETYKIMYPDNVNQNCYVTELPIIQYGFKNCWRCLLCTYQFYSVEKVLTHRSSNNHLRRLNTSEDLKILQVYHNFWKIFNNDVKKQQIFFDGISQKEAKCLACNKKMLYAEVCTHIQTCAHIENTHKCKKKQEKKEPTPSPANNGKIPWLEPINNIPPNQLREMFHSFLYPEHYINYLQDSDDTLLPLLKRGDLHCFWCMVCVRELPVKSPKEITTHTNGSRHNSKLLQEPDMGKILNAFVNFWKTVPAHLYIEQLFLHPLTCCSVYCSICYVRVEYKFIRAHVVRQKHITAAHNFLKKSPTLWETIISNKVLSESISNSSGSNSSSSTSIHKINEGMKKLNCKDDNKNSSVERVKVTTSPKAKNSTRIFENSLLNGALKNSDANEASTSKSTRASGQKSDVRENQNRKYENNDYNIRSLLVHISDKERDIFNSVWKEESIYPLGTPRSYSANCPIMQLKNPKRGIFRCLICLVDIRCKKKFLRKLHKHRLQDSHIVQAENPLIVDSLKSYILFWFSSVPREYVREQLNFDPCTAVTMRCIRCQQHVQLSDVLVHLESTEHKKEVRKYVQDNSRKHPLAMSDDEEEEEDENLLLDKLVEIPKEILAKHQVSRAVPLNSEVGGVLGQLENRYRSNLPVLVEETGFIRCKPCKLEILPIPTAVKEHLDTPMHRNSSCIEKQKYMLICGVCGVNFMKIKSFEDHIQNHLKGNKVLDRVKRFEHFECATCLVAIWGDEKVLLKHSKLSKSKREVKLNNATKKLLDNAEREAFELNRQSELMLRNTYQVQRVLKSLETALTSVYPNCRAHDFGSRVTGLGNDQSDLDVFIDIDGDMYTGNQNQGCNHQKKIVYRVAKTLSSIRGTFSEVYPIASARTPIVQVRHEPTKIDCDLSFRHGLSVENSGYVRACISMQPQLKPLLLFLKRWIKHCQLGDGMTTYALTMMAIFVFQFHKHLPSVVELMRAHDVGMSIDGWKTIKYTAEGFQFMKEKYKPVEVNNIVSLILQFFEYYANFDFKTEVICPLLACTVKKEAFIQENVRESLPPEMETYIQKLEQSSDAEKFRAGTPICIQDPFDLAHNLTKAFQQIDTLQILMKQSIEQLNITTSTSQIVTVHCPSNAS